MEVKSSETDITRDEAKTGEAGEGGEESKKSCLSEIPVHQYGSTLILKQTRVESY